MPSRRCQPATVGAGSGTTRRGIPAAANTWQGPLLPGTRPLPPGCRQGSAPRRHRSRRCASKIGNSGLRTSWASGGQRGDRTGLRPSGTCKPPAGFGKDAWFDSGSHGGSLTGEWLTITCLVFAGRGQPTGSSRRYCRTAVIPVATLPGADRASPCCSGPDSVDTHTLSPRCPEARIQTAACLRFAQGNPRKARLLASIKD